jgi:23S rRNA (adenine2503-C2)-methyltransferase
MAFVFKKLSEKDEIKAGDRVVFLGPTSCVISRTFSDDFSLLEIGKDYVVAAIEGDWLRIAGCKYNFFYNISRFKKVERDQLTEVKSKHFKNGAVYALRTYDNYLIETTDTFLPFYTKDTTLECNNFLKDGILGDRSERWMIGVSTMSGCPVRCKFCATGKMKKYRNLTAKEIFNQVEFVISKNKEKFVNAREHKINYTRMGEPFLNIKNVRKAIKMIDKKYPGTHHYVSTIGVKDSDFSWIKKNITLQISLHSLDDKRREILIPYNRKLPIEELGKIRTKSNLKITINMTLVDEEDFDIELLEKHFDKEKFFIKLSPINENEISKKNNLGKGAVEGVNII